MADIKVAAYICKGCGLGERLDTDALVKIAQKDGKVPMAKSHDFLCSADGVAMIRNDIASEGVSPNDTGTLAVSNNVSLAGTCVMKVNVAGSVNDQVIGVNNLTYGGTLVINNISGSSSSYVDGQLIKLFDAAHYHSSFSSIVFPGVVAYDASNLTVDGTIKVVTVVSTTPVTITSKVLGRRPRRSTRASRRR